MSGNVMRETLGFLDVIVRAWRAQRRDLGKI